MTQTIQTAAIIGTGVIGASWATAFLARGMDVVAADPASGAEQALRGTVAAQWTAMQQIGLSPGASLERLRFAASPEDAVAEVDFIQENGPERLDVKRDLFRRLDEAAPTSARDILNASFSATPSTRPISSRWLRSAAASLLRRTRSNAHSHSIAP
jgi:carnitine 3-dehydrogenase